MNEPELFSLSLICQVFHLERFFWDLPSIIQLQAILD